MQLYKMNIANPSKWWGSKFGCSEWANSCSTVGTRLAKNVVVNHEKKEGWDCDYIAYN